MDAAVAAMWLFFSPDEVSCSNPVGSCVRYSLQTCLCWNANDGREKGKVFQGSHRRGAQL